MQAIYFQLLKKKKERIFQNIANKVAFYVIMYLLADLKIKFLLQIDRIISKTYKNGETLSCWNFEKFVVASEVLWQS